jgi:hypothetical protein
VKEVRNAYIKIMGKLRREDLGVNERQDKKLISKEGGTLLTGFISHRIRSGVGSFSIR